MRTPTTYRKSVEKLGAGLAGTLRCLRCNKRTKVDEKAAGQFLLSGWPECCGETMDLRTKTREVLT